VSAVIALLLAAVAAYAWDASRDDLIAHGVEIGDIDVGGLETDEARKRVRKDLVEPLITPVTVTQGKTEFVLNPDKLQVRADIDGMLDSAVEASRDGGLPARLYRAATGGDVDETIEPQITYSDEAMDEFIGKVEAAINREPIDATVEPSAASIDPQPGRPGLTLRSADLRGALEAAVQDPHQRVVEATADKVQPEVTTKELAEAYPTYLTVDRSSFQLRLWEDLKLAKTYTVAIGAIGFDTPAGTYSIQNKAVDPAWSVPDKPWAGDLAGEVVPGGVPENPLKERWLGIYDGAGIHGTDVTSSLGTAASHGCVRMAIPDVIELYDQVPVGTPIYIG
jgi:lipoprotein-anchoring transpeptidase ErfK/SrfK